MKYEKIGKLIKAKKAEVKQLEAEIKQLEQAKKLNTIVKVKNKDGLEFDCTEEKAQKLIALGKAELVRKTK